MSHPTIVYLAVFALLVFPAPAFAHAHLKSASPEPMSTVKTVPKQVAIEFTEELEPKFSAIEVTDNAGGRVDDAAVRLDPADAKRLVVGLKPAGAGIYTVTWRATATDTHKTAGSFTFTVAP